MSKTVNKEPIVILGKEIMNGRAAEFILKLVEASLKYQGTVKIIIILTNLI